MSFYYIFCSPYSSNYTPTQPYVDPNPAGPFSLEIKDAIKKFQPRSLEHLNNLKTAVGIEYNYLVDFEQIHKLLPFSVFKKNMVEIVLDKYLGALVDNIVKFVNVSAENKRSFILKTLKKNIVFNPFHDRAASPMEIVFKEDSVYIQLQPGQFGFLTEKTGENLQALF